MWQKHYRIAERQILNNKFKAAEGHALKALEFARAANNEKQIAMALSLLGKLYMDTDNPRAAETLRQAVISAEKAYGPDSVEVAEALELLACVLEFEPDREGAEAARLRALRIVESCGDPERLLDSLDFLVDFYVDHGSFDRAEASFLRALALRKQMYGALSEEVEDQLERYVDILRGLGRDDEDAELRALVQGCPTCGAGPSPVTQPPEVSEILARVEDVEARRELDATIAALRDAVAKLYAYFEQHSAVPCDSDPFRELKIRAQSAPLRRIKSSLAQLLRLKHEQEDRPDLLVEAADHLRQIVEESRTLSDTSHLLLTLLDLSQEDEAYYAELDELLSVAPTCATSLYTQALALFRREGSTTRSRQAMKEALDFNPYVPQVFGTGCDPNDVPDHFKFGDMAEAKGYYLEAIRQWTRTPGAIEFMIDIMARALPRSLRKELDRIAPPVPSPV